MTDRDAFIEELLRPVKKAFERAYDQGHADGAAASDALRRAVLEAVGVPSMPAQPATKQRRGTKGEKRTRAPKGAAAFAIDLTLTDGMTMRQLQDKVAELDATLNPKSIYNEIRRRTDLYRQEGGRWYRVEQNAEPATPPPSSEMNGAADHGTWPSPGESTARGPGALGEVRGT